MLKLVLHFINYIDVSPILQLSVVFKLQFNLLQINALVLKLFKIYNKSCKLL